MNNAELKQALFNKTPVMHNGIRYKRIYEIVYRVPKDKLTISAGLLDANENSITYVTLDKVSLADENETKGEKADDKQGRKKHEVQEETCGC